MTTKMPETKKSTKMRRVKMTLPSILNWLQQLRKWVLI